MTMIFLYKKCSDKRKGQNMRRVLINLETGEATVLENTPGPEQEGIYGKVAYIKNEKITIKQAAKIMGKCEQFIRIGLQRGNLPFGTAVKMKNKWSYYISPKLFYEYVGQPESIEAHSRTGERGEQ